jgi:hypothetical protein
VSSPVGPLSKAKVEAHIADVEREIEVLTEVRDQLQELADERHRRLLTVQGQLANFRELVEQRGVVEP